VPLSSGDASEVVKGLVNWSNWVLAGRGLYYAATRDQVPLRRQEFQVQYLEFSSGHATTLFRKEVVFGGHLFMAVSPDEKWILFSEAPGWQSELMLMENFR
jgi:hypothetical protein